MQKEYPPRTQRAQDCDFWNLCYLASRKGIDVMEYIERHELVKDWLTHEGLLEEMRQLLNTQRSLMVTETLTLCGYLQG